MKKNHAIRKTLSISPHQASWANTIYAKPSSSVDLISWLIESPHEELVKRYRKGIIEKQVLPVVLPAGIFEGGKTIADYKKSSGLIYVDIDYKQNPRINSLKSRIDAEWVKLMVSSSGGKGISLFIPIDIPRLEADPRFVYAQYYRQIESLLKQVGIISDPSCKNINRLRYASWDSKPMIYNKSAVAFPYIEPVKRKVEVVKIDTALKREIMDVVRNLDKGKIDITIQYNDWLYLAGLCHNVFGLDAGLEVFQKLSRYYGTYNESETNRKYLQCLTFTDANPARLFKLTAPKIKMKRK